MAATVGINFVRFYFHRLNTINLARKQALVALAYSTARSMHLAPKEIFIRADLHETTTIDGKRVKDPKGWHGTFSFKNEDQVERQFHVTSHGYTNGKEDFHLKEASHTPEKKDEALKSNAKVVWPENSELEEWNDNPIGYSHLSPP